MYFNWKYKIIFVCLWLGQTCSGKPKHIVAVVGGGIGGTSSAFFLQELLHDDIEIHLYEPHNIGGRLAIHQVGERQYEVGGSVIHAKNEYMQSFVKEFGLKKRNSCSSKLGIFNGNEFVFVESDWELINVANLIWRYGLDIYKLRKLNDDMLQKFSRIYNIQAREESFTSVKELLDAMSADFIKTTNQSTSQFLREAGLHATIIDELVASITRVNYGQLPDIHAFVGSVATAAGGDDLWAVENGNKMVPIELLKRSKAIHLPYSVSQISQHKSKFRVSSKSKPPSAHEKTVDYDAIILATPMTSDISRINMDNILSPFEFVGHYQRIVCTMVEGRLSPTAFATTHAHINQILTSNHSLFYNSVSQEDPVDVTTSECDNKIPSVYKVFSPATLSKVQLDALFMKTNNIEVVDWLAYPHYSSSQRLGKFELLPGVYYNNAIEMSASAMEMSVIAAKNAALLVKKYLGYPIKPTKNEL